MIALLQQQQQNRVQDQHRHPPPLASADVLPALPISAINVEDLERSFVPPPLTQQQQNSDPFERLQAGLTGGAGHALNNPWPGILGMPPPHPPPGILPFNNFGLGAAPNLPGFGGQPPPAGPPLFGPNTGGLFGLPPSAAGVQRSSSPPRMMQDEKPLQLNQLPGFSFFGVSFFCMIFKII